VVSLPPQVTVATIQPSGNPARPPDCNMPVLRSLPLVRTYEQVAIIEGLGNVFGHEKDVMPSVRKQACEIGADAIVIKESRDQTGENMTGYYINAVAIVYTKPSPMAPVAGGAATVKSAAGSH
jgi:hypothetical protein